MQQYKIYIQIDRIESRFFLFTYLRQQRHPDGAQVPPGNLLNSEEWEADYHNPKSQLNKQVRDRPLHVESL
jgi:hypothetical protein